MHRQTQSEFVHPATLGKGEWLAQRVVPAFEVAGFPGALAAGAVRASGKDFVVGRPVATGCGSAAVVWRGVLTQSVSTLGGSVAHEKRYDLSRLAAEGDPHSARVQLGTSETPKLVEFNHVARLGRQKASAQRRKSRGLFSSEREIVCRSTTETRWVSRRFKLTVATARRTSGNISDLLDASTRHALQARQQNSRWPQIFLPFLTMRSLLQAAQRGVVPAA